MKVSKEHIINGILSYVENEVIPMMKDDKPMQIILTIGAKSIKANQRLWDTIFAHPIVSALLYREEDGSYEIGPIFEAVEESVRQYGEMPVVIPAIPLVSPSEKTLTFKEEDIREIKNRIERSATNG